MTTFKKYTIIILINLINNYEPQNKQLFFFFTEAFQQL